MTKRFGVALSFPGEHRKFVLQVAMALADQLQRDRVFYDEWYEVELLGADGDLKLREMYDNADLVIPFFSEHYEKPWCSIEWRTIRGILLNRRNDDAVIPVHLDDTTVPGWESVSFGIRLRERSPQQVADLILQKIKMRILTQGSSTGISAAAEGERAKPAASTTLSVVRNANSDRRSDGDAANRSNAIRPSYDESSLMDKPKEFTVEEIRDRVRVVILCVIEPERLALENAFELVGNINAGLNGEGLSDYSYAEVTDVHGRNWGIAIGQLKRQGNNAANSATVNAIQTFNPEWIVLCGIAGAAPEDEFSLGDVYLATHIHDLSVSAALEGGRKAYRPSGGRLGIYAEGVINSLPILKHRLQGWNDKESIKCQRPAFSVPPDINDDQLYGSDDWKSSALSSLRRNFSGSDRMQKPIVVSGSAFSNNTLTKDTELFKLWKGFAKDASTVEIELAAVQDAMLNFGGHSTGLLSVRGISDIVGLKPSANWLSYAAAAAASFTKQFIRGGLLEVQRLSAPTSQEKDFEWTSKLPSYVEVMQFLDHAAFHSVFRHFSQLMMHVSELPSSVRNELDSTPPLHLCELILNIVLGEKVQNRHFPLFGAPGSGKTSMLAMLAMATRRRILEGQELVQPFVDYVNLHELDEIRGETAIESRREVEIRLGEIISHLENEGRKSGAILFLDGLDLHMRDKVPDTQKRFIRELDKLSGVKIVGIGKYEDYERKHPKRELHAETVPFDEKDAFLRFHSLPLADAKELCSAFVAFHDVLNNSFMGWDYLTISAVELQQRLSKSELKRVDLLRLDIIATVDEQHAFPFSAALDTYVRRQIEKRLRRGKIKPNVNVSEEMHNVAECLFRIWVLSEREPDIKYNIECWGLLTGHPVIRSFFHAYYVIEKLSDIGYAIEGAEPAESEKIARALYHRAQLENKLFPAETNVHCKWLLNDGRQANILSAIRCLLMASSIESHAKTHLCYLVGRIEGHKRRVTDIMREFRASVGFENLLNAPALIAVAPATKEHYRMLHCTLLISQARIAKPDEQINLSRDFINALRDKDWAAVALGFHLMYYGDAWFFYDVSERIHDHPDPVVIPYVRVLDEFEDRILAASKDSRSMYPSFDIEVAIICLLAMSRQQSVDLDWSGRQGYCRDRTRKLLEKVSKPENSHVKRHPVLPLAKLAFAFIKRTSRTSAIDVLTKLYECKYDTQRAGWLKQIGIAGRTESVADHSWSAMILAEAILPEDGTNEIEDSDYSKAEIIRMLLIHDLAEAFTGDRPSDMAGQDPDGPHRTQELHLIQTIEYCSLLKGIDGFENLVGRWQAIEKRNGINGKIANFFDKTDAFIQVVIYSKYYHDQRNNQVRVTRWKRFFGLLRDDVVSSAGGNAFLERLSEEITEWGDKVFSSSEDFLPHDEMYGGTYKYYPVKMGKGRRIKISADEHSKISRTMENSNERKRNK